MTDSDNVVIFGAGASFDAGIPLMAGFVEKMWEFAERGQVDGEEISATKKEVLNKAMIIRKGLDIYHGRAMFDDRNLEDILSILSFNEIAGEADSKDKFSDFVNAITVTIGLACNVKHSGSVHIDEAGHKIYRRFWVNLIKLYKIRKTFPTFITFNYDLVIETALFQTLMNILFTQNDIPFRGFNLKYYYDNYFEEKYRLNPAQYLVDVQRHGTQPGLKIIKGEAENFAIFEFLKLHGSINFPAQKTEDELNIVHPVVNPLIMPPIFNKMAYGKSLNQVWSVALKRLRKAKNVIIVGYSLPQTDIYMQYFLKTALGPNDNLNRIYVFDPILFKDNTFSDQMKNRYASCFSPQLQSRIIFKPMIPWTSPSGECPTRESYIENYGGTFRHFVDMLNDKSGVLF